MKKKVGIVTLYHENYNYGGLLQAYALQKTISELGNDAEQITVNYKKAYQSNNIITKILNNKILLDFYHLFKDRKYYYGRKKYEDVLKYFELSIPHSECLEIEEFTKIGDKYNIYVCGSDQIWNPMGWQSFFFLEGVNDNKKKIAYAPSVARDWLSESEKKYIWSFIKKFSAISVREKNVANILNDYMKCDLVKVMPDPTLLLNEKEWRSLCSQINIQKPFMLTYFLGESKEKLKVAKEYAKSKGLLFFNIPYMNKQNTDWELINNDFSIDKVGVEEFLSLFSQASIIVTDSFHGTVFSLLFKRSFWVVERNAQNGVKSMNSRIDSLLSEIKLLDHKLSCIEMLFQIDNSEIKYDSINDKIADMRTQGLDFLDNNIKL